MSYTALYRKFRPTAFEDVKGQDHIVTTLRNQIKADHTEHNTAGKAQQQTDSAVGILSEHGADQAAQPGAGYTGNCGDNKKCLNWTHGKSPSCVSYNKLL